MCNYVVPTCTGKPEKNVFGGRGEGAFSSQGILYTAEKVREICQSKKVGTTYIDTKKHQSKTDIAFALRHLRTLKSILLWKNNNTVLQLCITQTIFTNSS